MTEIEPGFHKRTVRGRIYQIFVPRGTAPPGGWPCVLFLHGVGENGTDGEKQMQIGVAAHIRANPDFPAAAVFPQCKGPWKFVGDQETMVLDALEATRRELPIDPDRISLTGLSQGGCSTFDLGSKHAEKWAALVVVCGAGRPADMPRLARMPVWIFHGEKDASIPPSGPHGYDPDGMGARDLVPLLPRARYTEYAGAGHAVWDRAYSDPALWRWLFSLKRGAST